MAEAVLAIRKSSVKAIHQSFLATIAHPFAWSGAVPFTAANNAQSTEASLFVYIVFPAFLV